MKRMQIGSTMIELMISLVLSLVIIAAIASLFTQMQQSKDFQAAQSSIMEDSRFAQQILQREVRRAGGLRSRLDSGGSANMVFTQPQPILLPITGVTYQLKLGEYIKGDTNNNPKPANDSFVIRYQLVDAEDLSPDNPSNSSSPCTSNSILSATDDPDIDVHVVRIYFFINNGNLMCTSQRSVNSFCDANFGKNCALTDPPVNLISNVQKMLVLYGVDNDGDNAANFYLDAANLGSGSIWNRVVSVRLSLVIKSENTHLSKIQVPYTVDGVAYQPTDNSIYRVVSTTIALRNLI